MEGMVCRYEHGEDTWPVFSSDMKTTGKNHSVLSGQVYGYERRYILVAGLTLMMLKM